MFTILQVIDLPRFIQIFIVQGFSGLFFLFMTYKILKREYKGLNLILSLFYFTAAAGVIINIIYAFIFNELIVFILHFITYYLLCISLGFLLIFVLILWKSEKIITLPAQVLIIIIFGITLFGLLLIPGGITIDSSTNWKPDWNWPFFIYSTILCSFVTILPTIFFALRIYLKLEHQELKKKWKYFLIGIFAYFFLYYGTSLSNTLADPAFRGIWSIISLPTLIALYFIYYGVAKQL
ncbi:MAG: hypothetical protein ACFFFB_00465 [Candidatus Heimdallarchaeota archaeon]